METKEILNWIFVFSAVAIVAFFIMSGWTKENNRAKENNMLLNAFIKDQSSKIKLLDNVLYALVLRSAIVVFHDEEGRVVIRSVQTIDPDLAKKLIEREVDREEKALAETAEQAQ